MIHISGYFTYLAMVWSRCSRISEGPLHLYFCVILIIACNSLVPRLLCVGGGKRAWYTLFVHAEFPHDFWEFGNFGKICSVTLTCEAHRLLPYKRCLPLTTLCVDDDEEATKVLSSSLAGVVHVIIHSSLTLWHTLIVWARFL